MADLQDTMTFASAGDLAFKHRGLLLPVALFLLVIPSPRLAADPTTLALLGIAVALVGQAIRVATIGLVYVIRGGRDHHVYAEELVTGGIYAHCRNPMYLGNAFLLAGLALASNSWVFVLVGVPIAVLTHAAIIAAEERYLRAKFGTRFDDYCINVPRFVPRLRWLGGTFASHTFDVRRVLLNEYARPFDWLVAISLVAIVNSVRAGEFAPREPAIMLMELVIIIRLGLWMVYRTLSDDGSNPGVPGHIRRVITERGSVVIFAILLLPLSTPPSLVFGSENLEHLKDVLAVAAVLAGLMLRIAATAETPVGGAPRLAPVGLANLLVAGGIVVMHGDPAVMALGSAAGLVFYATVRRSFVGDEPVPSIAAAMGYFEALRQEAALVAATALSLLVIELDEEMWPALFPAPVADLLAFGVVLIACVAVLSQGRVRQAHA